METITIKKQNAQKAYALAPDEFKESLRVLLGNELYRDPMECESFEELCQAAGIDIDNELPFPSPLNKRQVMCNGAFKLDVIFEQFNKLEDGTTWQPDYEDGSQWKYYPWGEWSASVGGFVCTNTRYTGTVYTGTYSYLGARLCTNTGEKAKRIAVIYEQQWNEFLNPQI